MNIIIFVGQIKEQKRLTFQPEYVHDPNLRSHIWSSKGNQVISILHVLLNIPGGT